MTDPTFRPPLPAAFSRPGAILAAVALVQLLLWTVLPPLVSASPPLDVVEGYLWGREWPLLTYKHPQLPAWLLEIGHLATGSFVWPHYLIAQLFIVAAFFLVYRLGRDIMGAKAGLAGALLMTSLYYCEWASQQFNHDIAQIPFWAAIILLLWRAAMRDGWRDWLLLGLVAGIGLYAKFSTGVIIGFGGLWLLADARARSRLKGLKPWVALALFLAVAAPLAFALHADDLLPLRYAAARTGWVTGHRSPFYFAGVQLGAHAVLLVVIAATGLITVRRAKSGGAGLSPCRNADDPPAIAPRALAYLAWMALGPGVAISVVSLFVGIGEAWATPMFDLSGLLAVALLRRNLCDTVLRRLVVAAPVCIALWVLAYGGLAHHLHESGRRMAPFLIPQAAMAARLDAIWRAEWHRPLTIIAGADDPVTKAAALSVPGEASYFTDLSPIEAPWVTPERIAREGMMMIWSEDIALPDAAEPYLAQATRRGVETFRWSPAGRAGPVLLNYAIVPPRPGGVRTSGGDVVKGRQSLNFHRRR